MADYPTASEIALSLEDRNRINERADRRQRAREQSDAAIVSELRTTAEILADQQHQPNLSALLVRAADRIERGR